MQKIHDRRQNRCHHLFFQKDGRDIGFVIRILRKIHKIERLGVLCCFQSNAILKIETKQYCGRSNEIADGRCRKAGGMEDWYEEKKNGQGNGTCFGGESFCRMCGAKAGEQWRKYGAGTEGRD